MLTLFTNNRALFCCSNFQDYGKSYNQELFYRVFKFPSRLPKQNFCDKRNTSIFENQFPK